MSGTEPNNEPIATEPQKPTPKEPEKARGRKPAASKSTAKLAVTANDGRGALYYTQHVDRTMVIYPLNEAELRNLSLLNAVATTLFSAGFSMLMFCAGLYFDLEIGGTAPAPAVRQVHLVNCVFISAGLLCVIGGIVATAWRRSDLGKILAEAKKNQLAQ